MSPANNIQVKIWTVLLHDLKGSFSSSFAEGEPNDSRAYYETGENCVEMACFHNRDLDYILGWNDDPCAEKKYFACESKYESEIKILMKYSSSNHAISLLNIRFQNYQTIFHTI